jgi:hypothetical protein
MEGISGVEARWHGQRRPDFFGTGNRGSFLADAHLEPRFLTLLGRESQQMGGLVLGRGCGAHGKAVKSHGLLLALRTTRLDPGREHHLAVTPTQAGQQATRE